MSRLRDVVVVGGGPAGLALAIAAATRGLDVTVLERGAAPLDKACGEGLLPAGRRALEALGVVPLLPAADVAAIREIHWLEADGIAARLALPSPGGMGIRRTALRAALVARAAALDVELLEGVEVIGHARAPGRVRAEVAVGGAVEGRVLVAADGLASPVRRREGLDRPVAGPRRFGVRRHFAIRPWSDAVEVHFGERMEAYVTPAGAGRVGVAILFERGGRGLRNYSGSGRNAGSGRNDSRSAPNYSGSGWPGSGWPDEREPGGFDALLARFPAVVERLRGAPAESAVRGAGPFARASRARVADRLVLLGDAAGYLDAVTGEGLSLAFGCALDLAALLPGALARGASAVALAAYERAWRRRFLPYVAWTRLVLGLSRHPGLRRRVLAFAAARPRAFERVVAAAVG